MRRFHDVGGVSGYGEIRPEACEPVFHDEWQGRVFGMMVLIPDGFSRRVLENLDEKDYMAGYYQRWMSAMETSLIRRGIVTVDELEEKTEYFRANMGAKPIFIENAGLTAKLKGTMYRQRQPVRKLVKRPAFQIGDKIRVRRIKHLGHTRLPSYIQNKCGIVFGHRGAYDCPDDFGEQEGQIQNLYNIRFSASDVWSTTVSGFVNIHIDMWESYITDDVDNDPDCIDQGSGSHLEQ